MLYTRRDIGKIALATGLASTASRVLAAAKPNSKIQGVQVGTITYSFRSMPDQSAEATLKYTVDSGISAIELMGGPVNDWARKKGKWDSSPAAALAAAAGGRGRGPGGGRGPDPTYPAVANLKTGFGNDQPAGQWNGKACPAGGGRGPGGGGRGPQTEAQKAATDAERKWRLGLSMDIFRELRKMYDDAGVSIYAVKDVHQDTDEDLDYTFTVARILGVTHVTLEAPTGPEGLVAAKRLGDWALKYKVYAAYHTHQQGSMTAEDALFAASKGNMANVDLGHFMAATNPGGSPLDFLNKFHDRIASFHLKDRTTVAHCELNLPWGTGETPVTQILQTVQQKKWTMPATIELEYDIPPGSDAVKEVTICLDYCRKALGA